MPDAASTDTRTALTETPAEIPVSVQAREALRQLFLHGPTRDGDLVSKDGRDELVKRWGWAKRVDGWNLISANGVAASIAEFGFDTEKDQRALAQFMAESERPLTDSGFMSFDSQGLWERR